MLNIDPVNLICTVVNLLILFVALKVFLFKPVQKIIAARQEEADRQLAKAQEKQTEADELKEKYQTVLADAETEKKQILKDARNDADAQYQKIIADAKDRARQIEEKASADAENQKAQILKNTEQEIADMVVSAAQKIVGTQNGAQIDKSLYDEFLVKAGEE